MGHEFLHCGVIDLKHQAPSRRARPESDSGPTRERKRGREPAVNLRPRSLPGCGDYPGHAISTASRFSAASTLLNEAARLWSCSPAAKVAEYFKTHGILLPVYGSSFSAAALHARVGRCCKRVTLPPDADGILPGLGSGAAPRCNLVPPSFSEHGIGQRRRTLVENQGYGLGGNRMASSSR